jgi:hypothetical protein
MNLDFNGKSTGTFTLEKLDIGELGLIPGLGKVKVTKFATSGFLGTMQGTFQADMKEFSTDKIHRNVQGSFNLKQ